MLIILLFSDLLAVLLHVFFRKSYGFFNLDEEQNLASAYSGFKLMFSGILALGNFLIASAIANKANGRLWLLAAPIFFYLALDEMMAIHERVGFVLNRLTGLTGFKGASFNWPIYYFPLVILAVLVLVRMVFVIIREDKKAGWLALLGLLFFVLALTAEFTAGQIVYPRGLLTRNFQPYFNLIILEEGSEMMGASFLLAALASSVKHHFNKNFIRRV